MTVAETFAALFTAACENRDADAFFELWADEPTITMWGSDEDERAHGPAQIRALGEQITATSAKLRFAWDECHVHERGDTAWVNARGSIDVNDERRNYRMTAVFVRTPAGWRWHTFDGSVPDS
jgi:ketosteroid isomerase-like protein